MSSSKPIPNVKAGDTPTLLDAELANRLIDAVNDLRNAIVVPQGYGKVTVGDKGVIIDVSPIKDLVDQLANQLSGFSQAGGGGGVGGGGGGSGGTSTAVRNAVNGIISGLQGMTLTLTCDPVTRDITGTINLVLPDPI